MPLEPGEIQEYLESYARHFGLGPRLRLETRVSAVNRVGNKWHLQLTKLDGESEEQAFDRLVLCTGLNHSPKQIHFDGIEDFKGQVFNTHTYKRQGDLYKLHSLAFWYLIWGPDRKILTESES